MTTKYYRLRIPAISLLWLYVAAPNKRLAIQAAVRKINSKTIDYSPRKLWEVEELTKDEFWKEGTK